MRPLEEIDTFGAIDAESDDLLFRCFEIHPGFSKAFDTPRFLIVGRKGSGKTAIYKKLMTLPQQDATSFSVGHSFADYPWHYHDLQAIPAVADQERYLHSWRYLILLSLSKILLNYDQPWSDAAYEPLGKIESFVVDTYGSRDPDISEIFHPAKKLRHLKSFNIDLKLLKLEGGPDELAMGQLPKVFQDVNKSLQRFIIAALNPKHRYYVCFDQLDVGFDPLSKEYKDRLIGLILAARDFATAARESNRFLKVLVFLRSDIYQKSLLFDDKNKITDTYKVDLEWDRGEEGASLKSLMNLRFGELLNIKNDNAWNVVFDETAEMKGHQTKYQHILDRTFRRPRDVIKFCNCILTTYQRRRREQGGPLQFINEDVNLAHVDYSNYLRDEIVDEMFRYIPDHRIYFEILRQIGVQQFSQAEFLHAYGLWKDRFEQSVGSDDVLFNLYEFSIIGFYRAGGSGYGGAEYIYKYLDERAEFNRSAGRYRVHWGLVDTLSLKQYSRAG